MNQIARLDLDLAGQLTPVQLSPAAVPAPKQTIAIGRRGFLTTGVAAGGGLLIGLGRTTKARAATASATVNVFVVIAADNTVTIITPGGEMGQGINGGLAQVLAEELPLDWTTLSTTPAPFGNQYGRGATKSQITGGSFNMRGWFPLMLQAGATARELLLAAARQTHPSSPQPFKAANGVVVDANGATVATFGSLAPMAATMTLAGPSPTLSSPSTYKVIGKAMPRPDVRLKVDGSAIFGLDVRLPGMVYAAVRNSPTIGGTVKSAPASSGSSTVVNLGNAVVVTGANTWAAIQAASSINVSWTQPAAAALALADSASLAKAASALLTGATAAVAETSGDVAGALAIASQKLDLTYTLPFLAHGCMEVLNCTVSITKSATGAINGCQMWCPTQAPDWCAATAAKLTGLPLSAITVTTTYMGGGLGRKIEQDYVAQAVATAMAVNKPVKLTWSREEDFGHDWYRPMALGRVQIGLDKGGNITAWANRIVAPSLTRSHGGVPKNGIDGIAIGAATGLPYAFGSRLVEYAELPNSVPIGYWRSVGESLSCFMVESAIDEAARAVGVDPYKYRRTLLAANAPALAVLDAAAKLAGWATPPAAGHARGIAFSPGFGSLCAVVAELALTPAGAVQVVSFNCAVDCGLAVNPDQVVRQIEGGLLQGLNAALWQQVTFNHGAASARNFDNYPMGRMAGCPAINVVIVNQGSALGGVGEVGVPGAAPALANAYAALTGTRKRSLPLGIVPAPKGGD